MSDTMNHWVASWLESSSPDEPGPFAAAVIT